MTGTDPNPTMSQPTSTPDLAAVLAAHRDWLNGNGGQHANLSGADLYGADLYGADLRNADLSRADLSSANLYGANLRNADLRNANLRNADLHGADLRNANLYGADLSNANLYGANLRNADLRNANLYGACVSLLLGNDGRGYQLIAHHGLTSDGEPVYLAGCRKLTITGARKHWDDPNHETPESAAKILAAIEAHHTSWGANR